MLRIKVTVAVNLYGQQVRSIVNDIPAGKVILPELEQLLKIVDDNTLPQKDQRYLISFASAFTIWGWDMQNPTDIFLLITKLNNDYKHL